MNHLILCQGLLIKNTFTPFPLSKCSSVILLAQNSKIDLDVSIMHCAQLVAERNHLHGEFPATKYWTLNLKCR